MLDLVHKYRRSACHFSIEAKVLIISPLNLDSMMGGRVPKGLKETWAPSRFLMRVLVRTAFVLKVMNFIWDPQPFDPPGIILIIIIIKAHAQVSHANGIISYQIINIYTYICS